MTNTMIEKMTSPPMFIVHPTLHEDAQGVAHHTLQVTTLHDKDDEQPTHVHPTLAEDAQGVAHHTLQWQNLPEQNFGDSSHNPLCDQDAHGVAHLALHKQEDNQVVQNAPEVPKQPGDDQAVAHPAVHVNQEDAHIQGKVNINFKLISSAKKKKKWKQIVQEKERNRKKK